jgi:hypothetical protein
MKYEDLQNNVQKPYFFVGDPLLSGGRPFHYQLSLWTKKGYLLRLKNGAYAFAREKERIRAEELATFLYEPSYLSLESALAWYGLIPEMVYAYVSVTPRINRKYKNAFGAFLYRHIKPALFWGYTQIKTRHGHILMAEPEKAILDYLYLNLANINSDDDFENIRFNTDVMEEKIDAKKMQNYIAAFGGKKLERWAMRCLP